MAAIRANDRIGPGMGTVGHASRGSLEEKGSALPVMAR